MKQHKAMGICTVTCGMAVDAENEKDAIEKANEEFDGLSNYVGNGGADKLIGATNTNGDRWIAADGDPEFDECGEMEDVDE